MIDSEGDEMELFVNTFVRALLAGNNTPQVEYEVLSRLMGIIMRYITDKDLIQTVLP